jgi:uncharacterized protein (DUF1800 family)
MDDRAAVAWLHRRIGLGLSPAELDTARSRGADAELARLVSPGDPVDPWASVDVPTDPKAARADRIRPITAWLDHLSTTSTPMLDRLAWILHGWLVSSMDKVRSPAQMVGQIRLYRAQGAGPFPDLLRAVATDPAMLWYLDGTHSTAGAPNENFAREMLELFSLGVGTYGEADVQAGARALTGWTAGRADTQSSFRPRRHDDTAQQYLGRSGVHDLDSVIAAATAQPAHRGFVARRVAREVLGVSDDDTVEALAAAYGAADLRLDAVVQAAARMAIQGDAEPAPVVLAPVPWLAMARRSTGASPPDGVVLQALRAAGQVPMLPPNVAGWPGGKAWFASSTVVARADLATAVAAATADDHPTLDAARQGDLDALADRLGLPGARFSDPTAAALDGAPDPRTRLALALTSPEMLIS